MKRNSFVLLTWVVALLPQIGFAQNRPPLLDEMGRADRVLVNGKIVSMDDRSITPNTPGHIFRSDGCLREGNSL